MEGIDVLVVGSGTAGLASAIKLKQLLNNAHLEKSVVVIDKSANPGYHNLSGAIVELECLEHIIKDWKDRKDSFMDDVHKSQIIHDELVYLTPKKYFTIPEFIIPKDMSHKGN